MYTVTTRNPIGEISLKRFLSLNHTVLIISNVYFETNLFILFNLKILNMHIWSICLAMLRCDRYSPSKNPNFFEIIYFVCENICMLLTIE